MPRTIIITRYCKQGEMYAEGLFSKSIGKRFPIGGDAAPEWSKGILTKATVHSNGTGVDLTIEITDPDEEGDLMKKLKLKATVYDETGKIIKTNEFEPAVGSPIDNEWRDQPIVKTYIMYENGQTVVHERA